MSILCLLCVYCVFSVRLLCVYCVYCVSIVCVYSVSFLCLLNPFIGSIDGIHWLNPRRTQFHGILGVCAPRSEIWSSRQGISCGFSKIMRKKTILRLCWKKKGPDSLGLCYLTCAWAPGHVSHTGGRISSSPAAYCVSLSPPSLKRHENPMK